MELTNNGGGPPRPARRSPKVVFVYKEVWVCIDEYFVIDGRNRKIRTFAANRQQAQVIIELYATMQNTKSYLLSMDELDNAIRMAFFAQRKWN